MIIRWVLACFRRTPKLDVVHPDGKNLASVLEDVGYEVDDQLLPYMVDKYGTDCWVYASDIPHAHRKPDSAKHILNRADLSDAAKQRILWEGTARLYGLESPLAS